MHDELQAAAEALAAELNRSVYIEAPGFIPLAVSSHYGAVDQARIDALLSRTVAPELIAYYKDWHLDAADKPVRIPANEALGLLQRVVYPVRHNGRLLAHIWLIDTDPPVGHTDTLAVNRATPVIGRILFRRDEKVQQRADADEAALRTLLRNDDTNHQAVLDESLRRHDLGTDALLAVLVARGITVTSTGRPATPEALKSFAAELGTTSGDATVIPAAWTPELVALVPVKGTTRATGPVLARAVHAEAARHGLRLSGVGLGSAVRGAEGLTDSYRCGRYCARVAESLTPQKGCKDWDSLGMLRMFADIPWTLQGVEMVHPGLSHLFDDDSSPLPTTVWTFLQCGGDVQEAVRKLSIHRGTLYYRLGRVEEMLDMQLADGEARFGLHAGLMLAKLAGLLADVS